MVPKSRLSSGCPVGRSPIQEIVEKSVHEVRSVIARIRITLPGLISRPSGENALVKAAATRNPKPWAGMLAGGNGLDVATMVSTPVAKPMPMSGPQPI